MSENELKEISVLSKKYLEKYPSGGYLVGFLIGKDCTEKTAFDAWRKTCIDFVDVENEHTEIAWWIYHLSEFERSKVLKMSRFEKLNTLTCSTRI